MPKTSVIMPAFNHAAFIAEAVESVFSQTEKDLELIVVDDGSTDNTLEILSKYRDRRLKVISQSNQGAHSAINHGLDEAAGDFFSILNSDDIYHPHRLEKAIARLEKNPQLSLIGSYIQIIDANKRDLGIKHGYFDCSPWLLEAPELSFRAGSDLRAALLTENYLSTTSNYVFTPKVLDEAGRFRPLRYTHDWDFALRVARHGQIALIQEPLLSYRVHPGNTIRENQAAMIFEICWCLAVNLPFHIADTAFFNERPLDIRIDQLIHSIYVFGADRVLSLMLLQRLDEDLDEAMRLLESDNPVRKRYLRFIEGELRKQRAD
jgi:glycosyltransferase involved in cell wall biosynthesis